jgi:large conductance mechanosensitive channel
MARGNVLDMAVGVLVGTAFNKVVDSLVNDVFMPPIGFLIGGVDFKNLQIILRPGGPGVPAVAIRYGQFINALLQFLIVGLTVFVVIQTIRKMAEFDARYLEKAISAFGGVAQEKSQEGPPPAPMS